jgi:hypothetical protein
MRRSWSGRPLRTAVMLAAAAGVWCRIAADGRLHWDEPAYWYAAAYLSVPEILAGEFQPSGLPGHSVSRVGHVLLVKLVASFSGPGPTSVALVLGLYLLMLATSLALTKRILEDLLPDVRHAGAAVLLCAFSPVVVHLAFKSVAEIPAALLATLATLSLLRSLRARPAPWLGVATSALIGVAFTKNHLALQPLSLVLALVLCGGLGLPLRRLVAHAGVVGAGALAGAAAVARAAGIHASDYFATIGASMRADEPLTAKLLGPVFECGPLLFLLPLAFLARPPWARLFALWFALQTVPAPLSSGEARYFVGNLVALAGLAALSIEGLSPRARRWWRTRRALAATAAVASTALVVGSAALAQNVIGYGVCMVELDAMVRRLDEDHGEDLVIVTPSEYTTFLYLRFAHPDRPVHTVFTAAPPDHRDADAWPAFQRRFYGTRAVQTLEQLVALGGSVVYLGTESDLTVADARKLAARLRPAALRQAGFALIESMHPFNPFVLSWMWDHPRVRLTEERRLGHYVAMRGKVWPADAGGTAP